MTTGKIVNAITSRPIPAASMLMLELSKWLPDERMHLFKAHLPSSLISADILLGNPLNPIPDKWIWLVNKHPTSLLLKYYAPVTRMLLCINFHAEPSFFQNAFWWSVKSCYWNWCYLEVRVTAPCLDASREKPACHGWGSLHVPLPRAAEVCWRQQPCPKPGQTDLQIQLPTPKVCVNLVYLMCVSQAKGNAARLWSRVVCLVVEGHHRCYLGFSPACEAFCNLYCGKW